jgi:hypothetical protein
LNKFELWDSWYNKFLEFRKNSSEDLPPSKLDNGKENPLYNWCRTQRNKRNRLLPEQIKRLDDAAFVWRIKSKDEIWEENFKRYLEFRKTKPKGMPDAFLNGKAHPLHNWCRLQQRLKYKLTPDKLKKLNDANFTWNVRLKDWDDYYQAFLEFRTVHPKGMPQNIVGWRRRPIAKWCIEQIKNKHQLMPEFIQKLDDAGFEWE